jgi:hypothetical protein
VAENKPAARVPLSAFALGSPQLGSARRNVVYGKFFSASSIGGSHSMVTKKIPLAGSRGPCEAEQLVVLEVSRTAPRHEPQIQTRTRPSRTTQRDVAECYSFRASK